MKIVIRFTNSMFKDKIGPLPTGMLETVRGLAYMMKKAKSDFIIFSWKTESMKIVEIKA